MTIVCSIDLSDGPYRCWLTMHRIQTLVSESIVLGYLHATYLSYFEPRRRLRNPLERFTGRSSSEPCTTITIRCENLREIGARPPDGLSLSRTSPTPPARISLPIPREAKLEPPSYSRGISHPARSPGDCLWRTIREMTMNPHQSLARKQLRPHEWT